MSTQKTLKERRKEAETLIQQIQSELDKVQNSINNSLSQLLIAKKTKSDFQKLLPQIKKYQLTLTLQ